MKILFLGDIVGRSGRRALTDNIQGLRELYQPDLIIANAENSCSGFGINHKVYRELKFHQIDVFTSGNHIWDKKEIVPLMDSLDDLLRPANYPPGVPGQGWRIFAGSCGTSIAVINLIGRTFMGGSYDCPFRCADSILQRLDPHVNHVFVDFHAEATSEKLAMLYHLAGRVTAVVGTHTHVQTADERICHGTAYLTDAGMCGSFHSVIGMTHQSILPRFLNSMPTKMEVSNHDTTIMGVVVDSNHLGQATHIQRINTIASRLVK
ncbi:TIGR00282 family metallophosphoesterase [Desulfurispira natronophila]|uniref:TIGR00282 family metallophosphoesterase n=1 Tax=Desulfurispira natronophila TaxID=682562 RepID=A0A7W8DHX4_9BACT|nr:TIGR00282 family metallophosphoesterase [Desulfurispira natronophila]MBB5022904.1 hypothetical protein [Desulfurispira natronophila]